MSFELPKMGSNPNALYMVSSHLLEGSMLDSRMDTQSLLRAIIPSQVPLQSLYQHPACIQSAKILFVRINKLMLAMFPAARHSWCRYAHARGLSEPALLVKRGSSSSSVGKDDFKRTVSVPPGADPITLRASSVQQGSTAEPSLASSTPFSLPGEPEVGSQNAP